MPCFVNHLTIKVDNELFGIKAFTRTIVNISQLIEIKCEKSPTYLKVKPGLYIGNAGTGLELIKVENSITTDYHIRGLYTRLEDGLIDKDWIGKTVETVHLEQMALDSETYEFNITKTWYKNLFSTTVAWFDWFGQTWHHMLLVIGVGVSVIGSFVCIGFTCYVISCKEVCFPVGHQEKIKD